MGHYALHIVFIIALALTFPEANIMAQEREMTWDELSKAREADDWLAEKKFRESGRMSKGQAYDNIPQEYVKPASKVKFNKHTKKSTHRLALNSRKAHDKRNRHAYNTKNGWQDFHDDEVLTEVEWNEEKKMQEEKDKEKERMTPIGPVNKTHQMKSFGRASWYHHTLHGLTMANGKPYNHHGISCAHLRFPLGTMLRIRNVRTGKSLEIEVTDRGPYNKVFVVDLSYSAARELGLTVTHLDEVELMPLDVVMPPFRITRSEAERNRYNIYSVPQPRMQEYPNSPLIQSMFPHFDQRGKQSSKK